MIGSGTADGHVPFPEDLAVWLEDFPVATEEVGPGSIDVSTTRTSTMTVAGARATLIHATTRFVAAPDLESSLKLIFAEAANTGDRCARPRQQRLDSLHRLRWPGPRHDLPRTGRSILGGNPGGGARLLAVHGRLMDPMRRNLTPHELGNALELTLNTDVAPHRLCRGRRSSMAAGLS
jgi:hypothetical protein